MPKSKIDFEKKFKEENGEWKPIGKGWQSEPGGDFPTNPKTGEIEPWAESLRLWMFEMNQWAQVVTKKLEDLESRLPAFPGAPTASGGPK